jgi:hypothetical protein
MGSRAGFPGLAVEDMSRVVDEAIDEVDQAMRILRRSVRGIPVTAGKFRDTHASLTRDMAYLVVLLDSARARFPDR